MEVFCLGQGPHGACLVIKHREVTILVDPCLDILSLLHFVPQRTTYVHPSLGGQHVEKAVTVFRPLSISNNVVEKAVTKKKATVDQTQTEPTVKVIHGHRFINSKAQFRVPRLDMVNIADVDVILCSNWHGCLALPYVTEATGFAGKIFATEPSVAIGTIIMEELVRFDGQTVPELHPTNWKHSELYKEISGAHDAAHWRLLYGHRDMQSSLRKIQTVSFDESISLFGLLDVTPSSAGYQIGGCMWSIVSKFCKTVVMPSASVRSRHPLPLDHSVLNNTDVLILSGLGNTGTPLQDVFADICKDVAITVSKNGSVFVPCYPGGTIYDLVEVISQHLTNIGKQGVPLYFLSPGAKPSLLYANIFAEWLAQDKADKVFVADTPFDFENLVMSNRLKYCTGLEDLNFSKAMRSPCVIFGSHPSLRFGNAPFILHDWINKPENMIIFTEPDFPFQLALAPYQPLSTQVRYYPLDLRLTISEANHLISLVKPSYLCAPTEYCNGEFALKTLRAGVQAHTRAYDSMLQEDGSVDILQLETPGFVSVPIKVDYEHAEITSELARTLLPHQIAANAHAFTVRSACVTRYNNVYELSVGDPQRQNMGDHTLLGTPAVQDLVRDIMNELHGQVIVKTDPTDHQKYILELPMVKAKVYLSPLNTHVECESDSELRIQLRNIVLKHVMQL